MVVLIRETVSPESLDLRPWRIRHPQIREAQPPESVVGKIEAAIAAQFPLISPRDADGGR